MTLVVSFHKLSFLSLRDLLLIRRLTNLKDDGRDDVNDDEYDGFDDDFLFMMILGQYHQHNRLQWT